MAAATWTTKDITYLVAVALLNADLLFPPAALPPAREESDTLAHVLDGLWRSPFEARLVLCAASSLGSLLLWRWCCGDTKSAYVRRGHRFVVSRWWRVGGGLVSVGWGLRTWAKRTLSESFSYEISTPRALITQGPYRFLIHPGYGGILAHILGLAILFFDFVGPQRRLPIVVSIFAAAVASCCVRVFEEEAMLRNHFGGTWDDHAKTRWHLFPGVW
jgi:protein-S-isoprenylcysteine O-methyltransferase Ste14